MFCNWNESSLNPLMRIKWRASLVPAAAVIPAPLAYVKIVAVKTFEVDHCPVRVWHHQVNDCHHFPIIWTIWLNTKWIALMPFIRLNVYLVRLTFTLNKLKCSKQARYAWIVLHGIMEKDLGLICCARKCTVIFYWFDTDQEVMINRSSWGH